MKLPDGNKSLFYNCIVVLFCHQRAKFRVVVNNKINAHIEED